MGCCFTGMVAPPGSCMLSDWISRHWKEKVSYRQGAASQAAQRPHSCAWSTGSMCGVVWCRGLTFFRPFRPGMRDLRWGEGRRGNVIRLWEVRPDHSRMQKQCSFRINHIQMEKSNTERELQLWVHCLPLCNEKYWRTGICSGFLPYLFREITVGQYVWGWGWRC